MDSTLDFAIDIDKIDNLIATIDTEKGNMSDAISNIYSTLDDLGGFWEGEAYEAAKTNFNSYKESLNDSVEIIDNLVNIIKENKESGEELMNKIWGR